MATKKSAKITRSTNISKLHDTGPAISVTTGDEFKIFCLGDNHLKRVDPLGIIDPDTGVNTRLTDKKEAIKFFVDMAVDQQATHLVFLGDIYDAVNPPETLRLAFWEAIKPALDAEMRIVIIIGNHDTTGAINNFLGEALILPKNVTIVKDSYHIEKLSMPGGIEQYIAYVPYAKKEILGKWFDEIKNSYDTLGMLFGHFEIEGAELAPDNCKIAEGFPRELISGLAHIVWLGHIHKHQEFRKGFAYLGSMVKCDFGEVTNKKVFGIIEVSLEEGEVKEGAVFNYSYVPIPQRPMFEILIHENDPNNLYLNEELPPELTAPGVLLKFKFEGSDAWVRAIDKMAFKKRFPKAIRVQFDTKKLDADRKVQTTVVTANIIDRVYAYVAEKKKDDAYKEAGILTAKEVQEIEL